MRYFSETRLRPTRILGGVQTVIVMQDKLSPMVVTLFNPSLRNSAYSVCRCLFILDVLYLFVQIVFQLSHARSPPLKLCTTQGFSGQSKINRGVSLPELVEG